MIKMKDKLTPDIPPVLNNIIGKWCAFEVKVTSSNQDEREGYTVARVAEITNKETAMKGGKATEET